jgi:hypothetical protein
MASRHEKEAAKQDYAERARLAWMRIRVESIHTRVTAYDVLRSNGVDLRQTSDAQEEQFSCPFHGEDNRPSARVYPESNRGPSHTWCFFCQERSDAIDLWRKFNGGEDKSFGQILSEIEKAYGLTTPELPEDAIYDEPKGPDLFEEFERLVDVCERRLQEAEPAYRATDDLVGYLQVGSVLDKLRYRVEQKTVAPGRGLEILKQVLAKVGEVERGSPVG